MFITGGTPWNKGISRTKEEKEKISKSHIGLVPWNKGIPMSPFVGEKVAEANRKRIWTDESKKKLQLSRKGLIVSEETKQKLKNSLLNHIISDNTKLKISNSIKLFYKNNGNPNIGRKHSEESKLKMSLTHKGRVSPNKGKFGPLNHCWRGGDVNYGIEWTPGLKKEIKDRDGNVCRNPGCKKPYKRLTVHHINYIKKDCCPTNLITLCPRCNTKANGNRLLYPLFYQLIVNTIIQWKKVTQVPELIMRRTL